MITRSAAGRYDPADPGVPFPQTGPRPTNGRIGHSRLSSITGEEMPSAIKKYIDHLKDDGGLSGADIANIVDVSTATVSRWVTEKATPQPKAQVVLADLHYVVNRLKDYYSANEIRTWLYARHPQLDGKRAIDLINAGKTEDVLVVIDRLESGAYL